MITCYELPEYSIKLEQRANLLFRVTYGLQVRDNLDYAEACREFGEDIFHALACNSLIDNSL